MMFVSFGITNMLHVYMLIYIYICIYVYIYIYMYETFAWTQTIIHGFLLATPNKHVMFYAMSVKAFWRRWR